MIIDVRHVLTISQIVYKKHATHTICLPSKWFDVAEHFLKVFFCSCLSFIVGAFPSIRISSSIVMQNHFSIDLGPNVLEVESFNGQHRRIWLDWGWNENAISCNSNDLSEKTKQWHSQMTTTIDKIRQRLVGETWNGMRRQKMESINYTGWLVHYYLQFNICRMHRYC